MPEFAFDRYYRYAELTDLLQACAKEHPDLVRLESIGKSHEGRDIWALTVTDFSTGPDHEKPALYCDGNIHASEVSGSTAVLMILHKLIQDRPEVLRSRAFYLVPRLNPDGAEWALEDVPRIVRSSTRPYPWDEEDPYGLERRDVDGDGRILNMRVLDPNGPWKLCDREPRLMVRRTPGETGGTYYRLLPEGLFHHYDGLTMRGRKVKEGLDLNRNFPAHWRVESEQHGAGPYPTSEPEVRAEVQFMSSHPNICGGLAFHTFSGVLLRPPGTCPESDLPPEDIWLFQELGQKGTDLTGYPAISVFHDFKYHPKEIITGDFDSWTYEHLGIPGWTVEIWSPQRQAGITEYKFIDWYRDHPVEHDLMMLQWSDEKLEGKGYIDWYPFEHPQLGSVELGGWNSLYAFRNPPPPFLEAEVGPLADWAIWMAGASPKLELHAVQTEKVGEAVRIRFAVANTGWQPTNVTKWSLDKKLTRGVVGEIALQGASSGGPGSAEPNWLLAGKLRSEAGQLEGWNHVPVSGFGWHTDATDNVAMFEWVVRGSGTYELKAHHPRAGLVRTVVEV